jgi:hypothetical protein
MDRYGGWVLAAAPYTMGPGRIGASVAALVGLAGVVLGVLGLVRRARRRSLVALAAGLVGLALGGLVAVTADGGVGTGNGLGGAYLALVVGLAATVLSGLGLARTRRPA